MVQDKLWLPGLLKLKMLIDTGFFGRILSVRGEFGYWVFEGDWQPAQRPSWNYRKEDDGGIIVDMLCHWRYVLDNLFGEVKCVSCLGATHIPKRWDENGKPYKADADDAAYATFELEGGVIAQFNTSWCDARAPRRSRHLPCRRHARLGGGRPAEMLEPGAGEHAAAGLESRTCRSRSISSRPGREVPDSADYDNGFKAEWELFMRHLFDDAPFQWTLMEGAKGVQLAEAGLQELEGAALDRCSAAEGVTMTSCRPGRASARRDPVGVPMPRASSSWVPAFTGTTCGNGMLTCPRSIFPPPAASSRPTRRKPPRQLPAAKPPFNRIAYAAAHVVADPLADGDPWLDAAIDWERTIAFRRHLWSLGLRRRRGDGHRAARHGARLADLART